MNETIDTILTGDKVHETFLACLFQEGEDTSNHKAVEGITVNVGFDPKRLEEHRETIRAMLDELPDEFREDKGGGWSFLNMCDDKHGRQWTGFHPIMEELCLLGMALDMVCFLMPRDVWGILPGGMPYIMVKASS